MATPSSTFSVVLVVALAAAAACTTTTTSHTEQQHLHFYMHDDYAGPRPSAMRVVSGSGMPRTAASSSPRRFGDIVVFNNPLTAGPRIEAAARVGAAQGFGVRVAEGGAVTDLSMHLVMADGSGSVAVKGRVDLADEVRESTVVGGAGRFRNATGYVLTRNYGDYDLAKGGVVEIDVYLQK